jgi:hypothetical protein
VTSLENKIRNSLRAAMGSANRLKLGLFGANCSSGRAVTMVPERWSGSWPDCVKLAEMADRAGIEFMLPIGRWKGYGGRPITRGPHGRLSLGPADCWLRPSGSEVSIREAELRARVGEGKFGIDLIFKVIHLFACIW